MKLKNILVLSGVFLAGCGEPINFDTGSYICNGTELIFRDNGYGEIRERRGSPFNFYYELDGNKILIWDRHARSGSGKVNADRDEFEDKKLSLFSIENGTLIGEGEIGEKFGTCKQQKK